MSHFDGASCCCKKTTAVRRMCFLSFINVFISLNNYFRYGWIIRTCLSMSCAWCCTWLSWAWTTKFKTTRRMRFDRLSFGQSCCYTHGVHLLILVQMVPGTLHWGALPWQLVPWHEPPLQFAPCHQLREGPCPWDSSWGEERGSTQHQHRSLFLWPGKKKNLVESEPRNDNAINVR